MLFTIPRRSIICTENSALPSKIPNVFAAPNEQDEAAVDSDEDGSDSQDSWTRLILVMMYEYFQGEASQWKPYLDILPTTFNTPMFWTTAELAELQASSVVSRIGAAEADNMIAAKIIPAIRANEDIFFPAGVRQSDEELTSMARNLGSTIMAYAFDLEKDSDSDDEAEEDEWVEDRDGKTELGMVPMADVLNADADFNAHISHGADALTATSLRKIRAGEEVLNYYGPLGNGELLRRYGYVTAAHRRWDVVELSWTLVEAALKEVFGMSGDSWGKVLGHIDEEEIEDGFVIEWGGEEPDAEGRVDGKLEFHGLPEELADQVKTFLKAVRKVDASLGGRLSSSEGRKEVYLRSVLRALESRIAEYPTTLEADILLQTRGTPTDKVGMALTVRIGEKTLLHEALKWIGAELAKLDHDVVMTEEPAAKRQRTKR